MVSLGFSVDGNRIRKKVSGKTRTEVKDKLKGLHSELDAGVRTQISGSWWGACRVTWGSFVPVVLHNC